jgi:hypothetical protein
MKVTSSEFNTIMDDAFKKEIEIVGFLVNLRHEQFLNFTFGFVSVFYQFCL